MYFSTRRAWLQSVTGAIAASAAAAPISRHITVAGHAWVYAAPLPGYDFFPVLDTIFSDLSYARLDAVELMERALRHPEAVDRIGELSLKYELPVIGTSYEGPMWDRSQHSRILDDASLVIERVSKLRGWTFGTSVGDAGRKKTEGELDAQAELVKKIGAVAKQQDIVLNLHNHIYEVKDSEYDLKGTLARIPDVKLGPDLDWLTGAGENPAEFVRHYKDRIVYMHLRDRNADMKWTEALGEGTIDYAAVARVLHDINYQGDIAIELAHERGFKLTRPLRESWKMSREYVRKVFGY